MRELKKITQVEVALSLKKPQSYVAKVENLDRRIDIIELIDWVRALDITLIELIDWVRALDITLIELLESSELLS